jgi:hypothetical protein
MKLRKVTIAHLLVDPDEVLRKSAAKYVGNK